MKTKEIPSPRAVYLYGLLAGIFFDHIFWGIWFDINGREGSIQKIREARIDSSWTMPLQIVSAVTVGMGIVGFLRRLPARKP